MSDSDETICEDGEDLMISTQSQMSPSIIAPLRRKDSLDHKASSESEIITLDGGDSPEFLPPRAKIQRLTGKKTSLIVEPGKPLHIQELQSSQMKATFSKEIPAAERLKLIKEQEERIECLLVTLETSVKKGVSLKESPVFEQVKLLMTQVKTQLAEFTRYQQQQRQQIAKSSSQSQDTQDDSESQWTSETKQRILELANQQKELLKLFHCHKKLLEKVQELKQKAKSGTKHILPAVEMHQTSRNRAKVQQVVMGKSARHPSPITLSASTLNASGVMTFVHNTSTTVCTKNIEETSNRHIPVSPKLVSCRLTQSKANSVTSHAQVMLSSSQALPRPASTSCNPVFHSVPSVTQTQTSVTPSAATPQPIVQNVVLTGGQLYQVGDKQVYVLPQGLISSVTSSSATQANQPQQVKIAGKPTYTTSVAVPGTPTSALIPIISMAKSTQGCVLSTASGVSNLSLLGSSCQGGNIQRSSQTQSPSVTLPVSTTTSLRNGSTLPVSNSILLSASSALQQDMPLSTASQFGNQGSKQTTETMHSAASPLAINETSIAPLLQKSARLQSQNTTPSQNTTGVQSTLQATRTAAPAASKVPAVQSKSTGQSFLRRNSFGSDFPDMKSLLNHNVIEAGSNVLSIQFEGRKFEASLRESGLIESAGGETFRTPMAWMRAVTGSWNTVKQSQAYKMVHYKGTPLALFTLPSAEKEPSVGRVQQNSTSTANMVKNGQVKICKETSGLISSWEDVAQLLTNCRVMPIGNDELIPSDSFLPPNFWDSANEADIPQSLLADLDF